VNEFGNAEKWIELRPDIARFNARLAAALEPEVLARLKAAGAAWTEGEAIRETLAE
jgi:hypothetical protein